MPEPKNNTPGQRRAPKTILDDYLPDYSPRPKYVIATIYPPASEPLTTPDREAVDRKGHPDHLLPSQEITSGSSEQGLPVRAENRIAGTVWRESSFGRASPHTARSGSESAGILNAAGAIGTIGHFPEPSMPPAEPSEREPSRMELPRGKFCSLERNTSIISLLHRLHSRGFQGTCKINRGGSKILLVFDRGRIILAEYNNLGGDPALGMICTHRLEQVDALISELDDAQIRLSLEFNPSWKVRGNQEPSWVVYPGTMDLSGSFSGKSESESVQQALLPETGCLPDEPSGLTDELATAAGPAERPEEPGDQSGIPICGEADTPDWKQALALPLCPSRNDPVLSSHPGPAGSQLRKEGVDWKAALSAPVPSPSHPAIMDLSGPEHRGEGTEFVEGWKKALYMPVESAQPACTEPAGLPDRNHSHTGTVIPDFELLSADSGLFDDIPVKRKVRRASGPEPAEQWRSMGSNRGENCSV